jgi:hypothetical protein
MTPAEPPRIPGFMPERRDRIPLGEQAVFRATAMLAAPLSAYRRPLGMAPAPGKIEPEATTSSKLGPPPVEDELDRIMVKLKAAAARAQQLPAARRSSKHLVLAAAIALSMISGAVTAQYRAGTRR